MYIFNINQNFIKASWLKSGPICGRRSIKTHFLFLDVKKYNTTQRNYYFSFSFCINSSFFETEEKSCKKSCKNPAKFLQKSTKILQSVFTISQKSPLANIFSAKSHHDTYIFSILYLKVAYSQKKLW